MTTTATTEQSLWEELSRRCSAKGAFEFGTSLLDVLVGMGDESRTDFLRNVVENAEAAAEGVRLRKGRDFHALAEQAGLTDDVKLQALAEYIQLQGEMPELTVQGFFREVVGIPEEPAVETLENETLPIVVELEPQVTVSGPLTITLSAFDTRRVDGMLAGTIKPPPGPYGSLFEIQAPIGDGDWLTVSVNSGERGPYVEAYILDAAGMERATWPPSQEFFGTYTDPRPKKSRAVVVARAVELSQESCAN